MQYYIPQPKEIFNNGDLVQLKEPIHQCSHGIVVHHHETLGILIRLEAQGILSDGTIYIHHIYYFSHQIECIKE